MPGGQLLLAIENKLGVKYLTGTAEDHTRRIFDSVEDYPRRGRARTFSATVLQAMVREAGFTPKVLGVFPDYKHTRVVFEEADDASCRGLLEDLPTFPSRFAGTTTVKLASEQRVWREFVRDGRGSHFANSFLVIGDTGNAGRAWPSDRFARYFAVNRRPGYEASTEIRRDGPTIRFDRTYSPVPGELIADGVTSWEYVQGRGFAQVFARADDSTRRAMLLTWSDAVERTVDGGVVSLDAIPTNVIVGRDGVQQTIDSEFHAPGSPDVVIGRGLLWLARALARDTTPEQWAPAKTVKDVLTQIASLMDLTVDDAFLDRLLDAEARFQARVTINHLGTDAVEASRAGLREILDNELWDMPLGLRSYHALGTALKTQERLRAKVERQRKKIAKLRRELATRPSASSEPAPSGRGRGRGLPQRLVARVRRGSGAPRGVR